MGVRGGGWVELRRSAAGEAGCGVAAFLGGEASSLSLESTIRDRWASAKSSR